jgi:hypothetical protein
LLSRILPCTAYDPGANVFPFDYSLYALNEQYVHIEETTVFALGEGAVQVESSCDQ